jgi:hypothetical protein
MDVYSCTFPVVTKLVAGKLILKSTLSSAVEAVVNVIAPSKPLIVSDLMEIRLAVIVTVNAPVPTLEFTLKVTSSATVGTDAPPAPPEVADQFVVEVRFQFPEPPTQNLAAIIFS